MSLERDIDIVSVGEALIDFIGHQMNESLTTTRDYHRYLGGSPTNVAMNSARLGLNVKLVATVGNDGLGKYIIDKLSKTNVQTDLVSVVDDSPTSVIFISKTTDTPEFIPYRQADKFIQETQLPDDHLKRAKVFHTTCFALSNEFTRKTILNSAKKAFNFGSKLSIDLNYSPRIWSDRKEALNIINEYCKYNPLIKISLDDMERIFGEISIDDMFVYFHSLNVDVVCLTMGSQGVKLSQKGKKVITLPALKIEKVSDATGAGDAFWSGFLYAYIKEYSFERCLQTALKLAALKLQNVGRLPENSNLLLEFLEK